MLLRMDRGLHVCKYHLSKNSRKMGRKTKINMLIFRLLSAGTFTTKEEKCQKISLCKENRSC